MDWSRSKLKALILSCLIDLQVPFNNPCDENYTGDCGDCGGGGSGLDELVKVSGNDTTAGVLNGKLVAGSNITLVENNDGGNETFTINAVGGVAGEVNTGLSLGGDEDVFAQKNGVVLEFKGITAGTGISLTSDANAITINSTLVPGEVNDGINLGTGSEVFESKVGTDFRFRTLIGGTNVTLTENPNTIVIDVPNIGEDNTASNLGAGEEIFAQKIGIDFQFKTLIGGTNVSLSSDANTVTIDAIDTGEVNTGANLGSGKEVFAQKVGEEFQFRTLVAGTNITLAHDANTITINGAAGGSGEDNTASNQGAGEGLFIQKTGVDLEFKTLIAGTNVTFDIGADTITINASGSGGSTFAWYSAGNGVYVYADGTNTTTSKSSGLLTIDGNNDEIRSFRFVGGASDLSSGELLIHIDNNGAQDGTDYNTSDVDSIWPNIGLQNRNTVLPTDPFQQRPDDAGDSVNIFDERYSINARVTVKITGLSGDFGLFGHF